MADKLIPTGKCWCGCGEETTRGAFFVPGHDKKAEKGLREILGWPDVPHFLDAHGYGDGPGRQSLYDKWRNEPGNATRPW